MNRLLVLFFALVFVQGYAQTKKVSRDWTSFVQTIPVKTDKTTKFKLQGWAKVVGHDKDTTAAAGLWARVDNGDGENGFFDNMSDRPIISDQWQQYEIIGELTSNASQLSIGGICYNNSAFYFDDIKLFIQNEKGEFDSMPLENGGFENTDLSKGWNQGIRENQTVSVKEFIYSLSDDKKEGKQSLKIVGNSVPKRIVYEIKKGETYTPQIGSLVAMLNVMKARVLRDVTALDQRETDYLMDDKANRIGALIMHLAAAEAFYQVRTFEGRGFNEEEKEKWMLALRLGDKAREEFKGKPIDYYLKIYDEVRQKTLEEFKKRDDIWLEEATPSYGMNNYYAWFHVMEHQSSHLGQVRMIKKRIPEENEFKVPEKKVD